MKLKILMWNHSFEFYKIDIWKYLSLDFYAARIINLSLIRIENKECKIDIVNWFL